MYPFEGILVRDSRVFLASIVSLFSGECSFEKILFSYAQKKINLSFFSGEGIRRVPSKRVFFLTRKKDCVSLLLKIFLGVRARKDKIFRSKKGYAQSFFLIN